MSEASNGHDPDERPRAQPFRIIVAAGLALAIMLAFLSVVRVTSHGFTYRDSQLWSATMKLKVTQNGCPECRLYAPRHSGTADGSGGGFYIGRKYQHSGQKWQKQEE